MDSVIEKKKGIKRKHIPYIAGGVFILVISGWLVLGDHRSSFRVDTRTLVVEQVLFGEFNDYTRVNGSVMPITTVQLSPLEGGMVEEKVIEEGTMVRKGEVIIKLSNPNLNMEILTSEADLAEKENILRNTLVEMKKRELDLKQQWLDLSMQAAKKKRTAEQYQALYDERLISREEHLTAKEGYETSAKQKELVLEQQQQDSIYRSIQVENMEINLASMRENMKLIRQRVENLSVKAPIDGELGMLDVVLGEYIAAGAKIGQINDLSDYKIEALIDEHYIDKVKEGQRGTFDRQNAQFDLVLRRVFPEVRQSQFRVWLYFTGERPENIRSGQTYNINLQLGQPTQSVFIPRGSFYQTTGGKWIFVVSPDGETAYRRQIRIGRQNPQYYEVLEGLEEGEKIIVSGYETFGDNQVLILKE